MPVNDDELLARADAKRLRSCRHVVLTVEEYDALRAALAARPQPLFEGTMRDLLRQGVPTPDLSREIVVYPAVAGSATPAEQAWVDDVFAMFDEGTATKRAGSATPHNPEPFGPDAGHAFDFDDDDAVAGSATPTGDDDG